MSTAPPTKKKPQQEVPHEVEKPPVPTYPIVKFTDMPEESKAEIMDYATGCVDRFPNDFMSASEATKEYLERVYGPAWHVVIGETFAFDVAYDTGNFLYLFYLGNIGILIWKCF